MDRLIELMNVELIVTEMVAFLPRLGIGIVILFLFYALFRLTRAPLKGLLNRMNLDPVLTTLLVDRIYRAVLVIFGLVMAASQVGINVTAALTGLGVAGIAIGFAAQDILANIIAGFVIFMDKPFKVGDFITVDEQYGDVRDITLRSTRIRTRRNTYVVIPNKVIIDAVLENHSKHGHTRIDIPVGIAYKEDIAQAREVLMQATESIDKVLKRPATQIAMVELGDSSVNLQVRVWIENAADEMDVTVRTLEACKVALDNADIQIPFPHLQLFMDDIEDRALDKMAKLPRMAREAS